MEKIVDTLIVINSSNRSDNLRTHTLFPKDVIDWVYVVPEEQYTDYANVLDDDCIDAIPPYVKPYLSSQRQWVMEEYGDSYKYIWLMDDDLTFLVRTDDMKLKKCEPKHIAEMFCTVRKHLEEVPMVGVSTRLGNNRVTAEYDEINRVTRCYAMDTAVFKKVGATFAPFEPFFAQDFHMAICWLNKGYPNRILYTYAQEDIGSNAEGGCSTYRNWEAQRNASFWMAENHPEVTVRAKSSKNWKGYGKHRVDMTVQWKKAYKQRKVRKSGGLSKLFSKK